MFSRLLLIWSSLNLQVTKTFIKSWTNSNFGQIRTLIVELVALECFKIFQRVMMGKWCLHASLFLGNKDMFKNYKRFDFWHVQMADSGGTKPWKKQLLSYLKTIQIFNDFTCWLVWNERMLAPWTQVSDRCPLGYLLAHLSQRLISELIV